MVTEEKYVKSSAKTVEADLKEKGSTRKTINEKDVKHLSELVNLAETVSTNIDRLAFWRAFCYVGVFLVCTALIYLIAVSSVIVTYLIIPGIISIFVMVWAAIKMDRKIKLESLILRDLLNIIHPFKEGIFTGTHEYIHKAIFDMKLSRIKFSNIEDRKHTRQKEQPAIQPQEPAITP